MKIMVTGAAGFIAYHLQKKLLADQHIIIGIDNMLSGEDTNLKDLQTNFPKQFFFIKADINDLTLDNIKRHKIWQELLLPAKKNPPPNLTEEPNFSRIYHLACPASPPIYQKDMLHTLDTCYVGSKNIFEIALAHKARILIASTSEIYGDPEVHPQSESYRGNVNPLGPRSCYDEGKRVMETLSYIYRTQKNIEVRIARIFNTYGPRMKPEDGRVLTNFIFQALTGQNLTIFGDGTQTRSFCYVSDLIRGLVALMESEVIEPINLGSQDEFTILEMARKIIAKTNPELQTAFRPLPIDDPKMRRPDISKAKELLNWQTKITLDEGIELMIQDFRQKQLHERIS